MNACPYRQSRKLGDGSETQFLHSEVESLRLRLGPLLHYIASLWFAGRHTTNAANLLVSGLLEDTLLTLEHICRFLFLSEAGSPRLNRCSGTTDCCLLLHSHSLLFFSYFASWWYNVEYFACCWTIVGIFLLPISLLVVCMSPYFRLWDPCKSTYFFKLTNSSFFLCQVIELIDTARWIFIHLYNKKMQNDEGAFSSPSKKDNVILGTDGLL
jgi:hypothetical protein